MGLFTDGFKLLKKASEPLYKTPKSIQETIEIMAVAENGIFEVSKNKYSKCYRFQDINYTTATEDEQIGIFERYCKFLNSLDCNYKITINNKNKNMDDLRDKVLIAEKNDGFNNYRRIYNDIIEEKIIEGRQGIEQERYLTITIERKNFEEAKAQFATLEATIHKAFIELGAEIVPLNGNERLKVLYDYYHLGDEGSFDFDIKKAKKVGADFRNDLCNGMVKYFPDHFEDESKFCKALEDIDEATLSYAEIKAVATGNPLIREKMEIDNDVQRLKLLKASYDNQRYGLQDNFMIKYPKLIKTATEKLANVREDVKARDKELIDNPEFPMKAVKKMLVSMDLHLDASIDKLDNLAMNVQLDKEKRMENLKSDERKAADREETEPERVNAEIVYAPMVAEPQEYQYNADAFEARGSADAKVETAKGVMRVREDKAR